MRYETFFIKRITKELRLEVLSAFLKAGVDLSVQNTSQMSLLEIFNKKSLSKEKKVIEQENLKRKNCWDCMQQLHKNKSSLISELPRELLPVVGSYIFHQKLPVAIDEAHIPLSSVKVKLLEMKPA